MKQTKNKESVIFRFRLVWALVGLILGFSLILIGVKNGANGNYSGLGIKTEKELREDIAKLENKMKVLKIEQEEIYQKTALSDEYYRKTGEISAIDGEIRDIEAKIFNIKNGTYDSIKNAVRHKTWTLIGAGVGEIVIVLLFFNLINKRKAIQGDMFKSGKK